MGEKTAYEVMCAAITGDDFVVLGDTRFNRLVQLAESDRRERVANSLVDLSRALVRYIARKTI